MAKKRLSYPQDTPNTIQDITKAYIQEYFATEVDRGNIGAKELQEWIDIVEKAEADFKNTQPIKAFNAYRNEFVKRYMPRLAKQEKASDFYSVLLKKAQGQANNSKE